MDWKQKQKLASLLNNGQYEQAISLLQNEKEWDTQDVEIFVEGFDLKQFSLCNVIKHRLLDFKSYKMSWKPALRLEMLRIKLQNNSR